MNETTELIHPTGTAITAPVPTDLQALFSAPDGIKAELARIKAKAVDAVKALDVSKSKDRELMKSVAYSVSKRKVALDTAGDELIAETRKVVAGINAERKLICDTLDKLRDDIKAPALDWEVKEAARINAIRERLDASFKLTALPTTSADLIGIRAVVDAIHLDASWAEFLDEAETAKAMMLTRLDREIDAATDREEAAAELARLRKEAADRAEADRLDREAEAAEAAERQRLADEAAAAARVAQEAAEAAQRKAEQEAADLRQKLADAEAREAAERKAQAVRDADAKRFAEEAAEKARQDEVARFAREAAEAEQAKRDEEERVAAEKAAAEFQAAMAEQAKRDEEDRVAAEKAAAEFQAAMAEKAEARRIEAIGEIEEDLCDAARLDAETLAQIVNALLMGKIRNVRVVL